MKKTLPEKKKKKKRGEGNTASAWQGILSPFVVSFNLNQAQLIIIDYRYYTGIEPLHTCDWT